MMRHWQHNSGRFLHLARILGWPALTVITACSAENLDGAGEGGNPRVKGGMGDLDDTKPADTIHDFRWDQPSEAAQLITPVWNATACTLGSQCPTGNCVDGFCCDSKCDNKCMACSAAKKGSGVDGVCGSIKYDTDPDNDCPYGACDGKNQCKNYNGLACTAAAQCLSNYCVDGYCCGNICMGACQACSAAKKGGGSNGVCGNIAASTDPDNECNPGECNGSGACNSSPQPQNANGAACTSSAQCQSGYCADGVCCDSWCLGTCQACTASKKGGGADGTCGNIANDKDPDEECWGGACNGQGVCKQYNGVPCVDKGQCLSNYCVDGVCCGNICTGQCYACSESKKGQGYDGVCGPMAAGKDPENECNPGECNGSGACNQPQTPQSNGTTCVSGAQCASGYCVDGYCCATACTGLCQACSSAKKGSGANGTCGNIASETDPDSECGIGGRCGGNGTCRYYNGATCTSPSQCFSNYCVDGVCCGNVCTSICYACSATKKGQGGDGTCGPIASTKDPDNECNPGECNGSGACNQSQTPLTNGTACTLGTQCASGFCVDGVCCDTACTATCQACTATKKGSGVSGTCGNIKYDTDPDNECSGGACSGTGLCQYYNGLACSTPTQCLSNYCVDGFCCNNFCGGTCQACSAAKKGSGYEGVCGFIPANTNPDNECGSTCNGMGACNSAPSGTTCVSAADCVTGFCSDGYCCNASCSGACEACSVVGSEGTCSNACPSACATTVGLTSAPLPTNMVVAGKLVAIKSGDFNADGNADVVAVSSQDGVGVFLGQGNGAFAAPVNLAADPEPRSVALADLNSDGRPDIVSASIYGNGVGVFLNQGNGAFAPRVGYSTTWDGEPSTVSPDLVTIADFNGDGRLDLAKVGYYVPPAIFYGQGNGTFAAATYLNGYEYSRAVASGDFNADGKIDLAIVNEVSLVGQTGRVTILMNQGNGIFAAGVHYALDSKSNAMTVADLNADGKLDLAITSFLYNSDQSATFGSKVNVLLNQGSGSFAAVVTYDVPGVSSVTAANVNGDANVDLVATTGNHNTVKVLLGQGSGVFAAGVDYLVRAIANAVAVADIDNDTDPDLVIGAGDGTVPYYGNGALPVLKNTGNGVFGSPIDPSPKAAMSASVVLTGDLNSDGKLDLLGVANDGIRVAFGQGNGLFGANTSYPATSTEHPYSGALGDMNSDGKPDLVVLNAPAEGKISVRLNQGNGTFGPKIDYAVNPTNGGLVLGDFNGDGKLDVAASGFSSFKVNSSTADHYIEANVFLNNGNGTLGPQAVYSAWGTASQEEPGYLVPIAAGDVNADGTLDLVLAAYALDGAVFFLNSGNGQFTQSGGLISGYFSGYAHLAVADFTGDNKVDVAMAYDDTLRVWVNNGTGTFSFAADHPRMTNAGQIVPVDLDGDGKTDLAFPDPASHVAGMMRNQGNGTFGPRLDYVAGYGANSVAAADINADGRMDLAVANPTSNSVSILRGTCLP